LTRYRDPDAAKRIGQVWVDAYSDRGIGFLLDGRDAAALFAKALARDPAAAKRSSAERRLMSTYRGSLPGCRARFNFTDDCTFGYAWRSMTALFPRSVLRKRLLVNECAPAII